MLLLFAVPAGLEAQNDDMFHQKRERKRLWRRWRGRERKNKTAFNPYLEKKAKDKPSARLAKGNKAEIRHQKRMARRQMRKSRKKVNS
ncbi:MAG: hypothetical protein ACXVPQ_08905 [Bacteroidia bacterium]